MTASKPDPITQDEETTARDKLLEAGRYLFLQQEFHRVSIRRIAERAGVNSAMIAYYFGDKRGLFQAVVLSYVSPVKGVLLNGLKEMPQRAFSFTEFFRFFFRNAPRELIQILLYDPGTGHWLVDDILRPLVAEVERHLGRALPAGEGHKPEFARLVIQSLLVFPVLMKPVLETMTERPMDDAYYDEFAEYLGAMLDRAFAFNVMEKP